MLNKIRKGIFHVPSFVSLKTQSLLNKMLTIDPNKRPSASDILRELTESKE
jgi:serine/threonine protein kinase